MRERGGGGREKYNIVNKLKCIILSVTMLITLASKMFSEMSNLCILRERSVSLCK